MAFTDLFLLTPELEKDLKNYGYMDDIMSVSAEEIASNPELDLPIDYMGGDSLYRLKPNVIEELTHSENVFMSYEHAEEMLANAKAVLKDYVENFAKSKFPEIKDFQASVTARIQDRYVGSDAGALYVELESPFGSLEMEPSAVYYSGASEALPNSFSSWNWAFWLGSDSSPFKSEPFIEGYEYNEICSALEQFAQTLDESDFQWELEKGLKKLASYEETVESSYPALAKFLL